jgi:HNH endonuclease
LANRINFYTGSLKRFLNEYMEKYAPSDAAAIGEQAAMFRQTMQNVLTVFGPHSARSYIPSEGHNGSWGPAFSISVLEIQASALLGQDPIRVQKSADQIREHFLFLLLTNENVRAAILQATNNSNTTKLRWTLFRSLIQPLIDDVTTEQRFFSYQFRKHLFDVGQSCKICGNQILSFEDCTVDHILPYSRNGRTVPENAQLAHRFCNASKNAIIV